MTSLRGLTIAVIGVGTMGRALIQGLLASGVSPKALCGADPSDAARQRLLRLLVRATADNREAARQADVIILAVKPHQMRPVLAQLAPVVRRRQVVISIAAGVTRGLLQSYLPGVAIVRVMPNLPATVSLGFAGFALGRHATPRHRAITRAIFNAVGQAVELPERLFDAITAVSGSGPAYVFFLAQAWEEAAVRLGLPRPVAQQAIRQTLAGSISLLNSGPLSPQEWIGRVASKKGTTEAALRVLAHQHVARHVAEAIRAAARRSRQLSVS